MRIKGEAGNIKTCLFSFPLGDGFLGSMEQTKPNHAKPNSTKFNSTQPNPSQPDGPTAVLLGDAQVLSSATGSLHPPTFQLN